MSIDLIIYGSGFAYNKKDDELQDLKNGVKVPTSEDFAATANQSGGTVVGADTMEALVAALESALKGETLGSLRILGHGTGDAIGFKAKTPIKAGGGLPPMDPTGMYSVDSLNRYRKRIRDALMVSVNPGALVTLYACNSGIISHGGGLVDATAEVFRTPTLGFKGVIRVCTDFLIKNDKIYIKQRGWFQYSNEVADKTMKDSCADRNFVRDLRNLHPDIKVQPSQAATPARQ